MDERRIGHRLRSRRKRVPQARSQVYMLYTWGKETHPVEMCCTVCKGSKKLLSIQLHQAVEHNLLTQLIINKDTIFSLSFNFPSPKVCLSMYTYIVF